MNKENIFNIIINNLLVRLPDLDVNSITKAHSMKDLGANSIDRADILICTMEALNLKFPPYEVGAFKNIGALVDFLYSKI